MKSSASLVIPSILSCDRSRSSNSEVLECINDFSDSADAFDFVVSFSIIEDEEYRPAYKELTIKQLLAYFKSAGILLIPVPIIPGLISLLLLGYVLQID